MLVVHIYFYSVINSGSKYILNCLILLITDNQFNDKKNIYTNDF